MAGALIVIETDTLRAYAREERVHVVDRVDGHTQASDLAERLRIVAVESHQRRQVECRAQAGLPLFEQKAKAPFVCRGVPKPANCRIVHSRPRYIDRVNARE